MLLILYPISPCLTSQAALTAFKDFTDAPEIVALILSGEGKTLKFKFTAFYDIKTSTFSCKNSAAMMP